MQAIKISIVVTMSCLFTFKAFSADLTGVRVAIVLDGKSKIVLAENATTSLDGNVMLLAEPKLCDSDQKKCKSESYLSLNFQDSWAQTDSTVYKIGKPDHRPGR